MTSRSRLVALAITIFVFAGAMLLPSGRTIERDPRWNFIVILTDDQSFDSLPHDPAVMPYLQAQAGDPSDHWLIFRSAYVNTPLCCPSRATLLTGQYAHHTGVLNNDLGYKLDESATIARSLHDAGYYTGLVGKYLNQYPFGRAGYVPLGWDSWIGKAQGPVTHLYYDYRLIEDGQPVTYGDSRDDYSTDVFADRAVDFIRDAPVQQPFFLWFAPTAPHPPWISPPRHEGVYAQMPVGPPASIGEPDVSDKPEWVQELPPLDAEARAQLRVDHRDSFESLVAVDEAVHRMMDALEQRGDLDHTVVLFLSDNGYSFGEHRWVKKTCPYEECIHVPLLVRFPLADRHVVRTIVSAADIAPTIADLAGVQLTQPPDGRSLVPLIRDADASGLPDAMYAEWVGNHEIPPWWELRTPDYAYIELATGERELYDMRTDPLQLTNVIDDPTYADAVADLSSALAAERAS
jgi:N-acetylglucosamine-6-sulfatase